VLEVLEVLNDIPNEGNGWWLEASNRLRMALVFEVEVLSDMLPPLALALSCTLIRPPLD
jgi:hypothetical protein